MSYNVNDLLIDGKFVKISKNPIIDFLKFETNYYPFYKQIYKLNENESFKTLSALEPNSTFKYKKLSKIGVLYKGVNKYIYTHYGKHLSNIDSNKVYNTMLENHSKYKLKRIDFAYDIYGVDLIPLIVNNVIHSKRRLKVTLLAYDSMDKKLDEKHHLYYQNIKTIYIGSIKSNTSICIYKKHVQMKVTGPITRIELRLKNKHAQAFQNKVRKSNLNNINKTIKEYLNNYVSFKVPNKSRRLSRLQDMNWWTEFLNYIYKD